MSISSEISRLSGNVSDAFDAVDDMGGTVPSGATSDDLAAAIQSIPQSGGSSSDVFWVTVDLDLQTMSLFNLSHTFGEIVAAAEAGKSVGIKVSAYLSADMQTTIHGGLRVFETYQGTPTTITFDMLMSADLTGSGTNEIYHFEIVVTSNNASLYIALLNATFI